jgi:hypothetical protein
MEHGGKSGTGEKSEKGYKVTITKSFSLSRLGPFSPDSHNSVVCPLTSKF